MNIEELLAMTDWELDAYNAAVVAEWGAHHVEHFPVTREMLLQAQASLAEFDRIKAMSPAERQAHEAEWIETYAADLFKPSH